MSFNGKKARWFFFYKSGPERHMPAFPDIRFRRFRNAKPMRQGEKNTAGNLFFFIFRNDFPDICFVIHVLLHQKHRWIRPDQNQIPDFRRIRDRK